MSTSAITHRPATYTAAAAVVAALAFGSVAISVSHHETPPPAPNTPQQGGHTKPFPLTTTGGGHIVGLP